MNLISEIFHIIFIFSSLCVKYPQEKVSPHKKTNRFFLVFLLSVESLLEADPKEFWFGTFCVFFSLSLFSLCVRVLAIFVDVWSSWSEEYICWYKALYINRFLLTFRAVDLYLIDVRTVDVVSGWSVAIASLSELQPIVVEVESRWSVARWCLERWSWSSLICRVHTVPTVSSWLLISFCNEWSRTVMLPVLNRTGEGWYGPWNLPQIHYEVKWEGFGPWKSPVFWAPNGTRHSARCHFTGPKKFLISRGQPPPTCPLNGCACIRNITQGAV